VLILTLYIMMAMSFLIITVFSMAGTHLIITKSDNLHQQAYYLAETGLFLAQSELQQIVARAYEDCMAEFQWDPLQQPLNSLQECAEKHVAVKIDPIINKRLLELGYLFQFPEPDLPVDLPDAKIDVRIRFVDLYKNPSRLLISSRGIIGGIRRRIDAEVHINKISGINSSLLFEKVLYTGDDLLVSNGGRLLSLGAVHIQGSIQVSDNSLLEIRRQSAIRDEVRLINSSQAFFAEDMVCDGISVEGEPDSFIECLGNVYCHEVVYAHGTNNMIDIHESLYICPEEEFASAGVKAGGGARITLMDKVFINGTLHYETEKSHLFGMEELPVFGGVYHSCESIGGFNSTFYFPDTAPDDARRFFEPEFAGLSRTEQALMIYEYLNASPDTIMDQESYEHHLAGVDCDSIHLTMTDPVTGYTSGLIFAGSKVSRTLHMEQPDAFFASILRKMKQQTGWDFSSQLNAGISVSESNVMIEGDFLSVLNHNQPIICVVPEERDLYLQSGAFSGIIITNGSIHVPQDTEVELTGLMIAGENIFVEGGLTLREDTGILYQLLDQQDLSLRRFFRIEPEKPLFEIRSCREVLFNAQW